MDSDQRHRRRTGRGPSSWPGGANTNTYTLSNPDTIPDTDTNPDTITDTYPDIIIDTDPDTDPNMHASDSRIR